MGAKHFGYYENWRNQIVICANCGWTGRIEPSSMRYFRELMDSPCPRCDAMLAIVSYPTDAEVRAAAKAGNPEAIRELSRVEQIEAHQDRLKNQKLTQTGEPGSKLNFELVAERLGTTPMTKSEELAKGLERLGVPLSEETRQRLAEQSEIERLLMLHSVASRKYAVSRLFGLSAARLVGLAIVAGVSYGAYRLLWGRGWLATSICFLIWFLLATLYLPSRKLQ